MWTNTNRLRQGFLQTKGTDDIDRFFLGHKVLIYLSSIFDKLKNGGGLISTGRLPFRVWHKIIKRLTPKNVLITFFKGCCPHWSVFSSGMALFLLITLTDLLLLVSSDSYFMYTGPLVRGMVNLDVARNTTQLLDQLLQGYDSRLRPGFGGKLHFYFQNCFSEAHE